MTEMFVDRVTRRNGSKSIDPDFSPTWLGGTKEGDTGHLHLLTCASDLGYVLCLLIGWLRIKMKTMPDFLHTTKYSLATSLPVKKK